MYFKIIFTVALIIIISCKPRNKLNTDEKLLSEQIVNEEEQQALEENQRMERIKQLTDSIATPYQGFQFKENRSIDAGNPPLILKIAESRNTLKKFKTSSLGKKVTFIKLRVPPDTFLVRQIRNLIISDRNIITSNLDGIGCFDINGNYIEKIVDYNAWAKTTINSDNKEVKEMMVKEAPSISVVNNKLIYSYQNVIGGYTQAVSYDLNHRNGQPDLSYTGEEQHNGKPYKGEPLNLFSDVEGEIMALGENNYIRLFPKSVLSKSDNFVTLYGINNQLLCSFSDTDPIKNYSKTQGRGVEDQNKYYLYNILHLRQRFNDTIYMVIPPNRMFPKYILDFGNKRQFSAMEAIDPSFDLKDKFIVNSFLETRKYIFITYSQNYPSPNNAKSGTIKYNRCIYDKTKKELFHVLVDATPINGKNGWPNPPVSLENDLFYWPDAWPEHITNKGNPYYYLSAKELKEHLNSPEYKKSLVDQKLKSEFEKQVKSLGEYDYLILTIE